LKKKFTLKNSLDSNKHVDKVNCFENFINGKLGLLVFPGNDKNIT